METIAEALVFGEKTDVGHTATKQLISTMFPYPQYLHYMNQMTNGAYYREKVSSN